MDSPSPNIFGKAGSLARPRRQPPNDSRSPRPAEEQPVNDEPTFLDLLSHLRAWDEEAATSGCQQTAPWPWSRVSARSRSALTGKFGPEDADRVWGVEDDLDPVAGHAHDVEGNAVADDHLLARLRAHRKRVVRSRERYLFCRHNACQIPPLTNALAESARFLAVFVMAKGALEGRRWGNQVEAVVRVCVSQIEWSKTALGRARFPLPDTGDAVGAAPPF